MVEEKPWPMKLTVRISPNISKRLKTMRRAGGNSARAAEHAMEIIDQAFERPCGPREIGRLTRYGDARIPDCIKFDLIAGYRLIGVMGKREICFLFVGSHDECDHWIRNNAGLEAAACGRLCRPFTVRGRKAESGPQGGGREREELVEPDDYDPMTLRDLTDKDLRRIFCGISRKRA